MIHGDDLWSTLVVVREKLIDQVDQQLELKKENLIQIFWNICIPIQQT